MRWKQVLLSWVRDLSAGARRPAGRPPAAAFVGLPANRYLDTLIVTADRFLMAYVVMPRDSRLVRRWAVRVTEREAASASAQAIGPAPPVR
jgi:antibiotic biosynthesis monooxygenase (ABM) superfamily enzyme